MENLAYSLSLNLHDFRDARQITTFEAVSYTHLTLPTSDLV